MKRLLIGVLLLHSIWAVSQEKVKTAVDDNYVRNSLSLIVVDRGDDLDQVLYDAAFSIRLGDKFDINRIPTKRVYVKNDRKYAVPVGSITSTLNSNNVGKEIISFWYNRDSYGMMNDELVRSRGMYSVDDQDVLNATVSKLGKEELFEKGYDLVKGSYVMVLDYFNPRKEEDTYYVSLNASVYQVSYDETISEAVWNSWIYEDDSVEDKKKKLDCFNNLEIPLIHKSTVEASGSSTESIDEAVRSAYESAFMKSEKAVDQWNVTTVIWNVKPISAKIGTKEGLKNGQRYQVHKIVEDMDGNVESKSVGYIRATEIVNNSNVASGRSDTSCFYQISGGRMEQGMILKQKNDLKLAVAVSGKIGGLAPVNIELSYLENIKTNGTSRYVLLNLGIDNVSGKKISEYYKDNVTDGTGFSYLNVGVGYGVAFRPIRPIEIMPLLMIGGDFMSANNDYSSSTSDEDDSKTSWFGSVGARLGWQIFYPVQLFAQADATLRLSEGYYYAHYNDQLLYVGLGHEVFSLGLSFGVRVSF